MTWATRITVMRLLMTPIFVGCLIQLGISEQAVWRHLALGVFVFAALTDWLDGYLARRLNQVSERGAFLDALADKLLLSFGFLVMALGPLEISLSFPKWFVLTIVSRDIVLLGGFLIMQRIMGQVPARSHLLGKGATSLQIVSMIFILSGRQEPWGNGVYLVTALLTVTAGVFYAVMGARDGYCYLVQPASMRRRVEESSRRVIPTRAG